MKQKRVWVRTNPGVKTEDHQYIIEVVSAQPNQSYKQCLHIEARIIAATHPFDERCSEGAFEPGATEAWWRRCVNLFDSGTKAHRNMGDAVIQNLNPKILPLFASAPYGSEWVAKQLRR